MADAKATFAVELQDQTSRAAKSATDGLEKLRQKIQQDTDALRNMQTAMGRLKGATTDVSGVKKDLMARINATKGAIGNAQASYLKAGGSLDAMKAKTAGASAGADKLGGSMQGAGESAKGAGGKFGASGAQVAKGIAVAVLAVSAAWGALQRFALQAYDAARSLQITREAFMGSALGAERLESHIANLGRKVPQTRAEIQGIAQDLSEGGLAGNNLVTAMRAVATAGAVLPNAGAKIKAIAESAVQTKRLMIGAFDLKGTGLAIKDVAAELASSLKVSLGEAQQALMQGRVGIDSGLQAIDKAVEKRFGALAKKRAVGLESLFARGKEAIGNLFSKINFEPLLTAFDKLVAMLDTSTSTGSALAMIFDGMFGGMGKSATGVMPIVQGFIKGLIIGALWVETAFYRVRGALKRAIPKSLKGEIDGVSAAILAGKVAAVALGVAFAALGVVAAAAFLVVFAPIIAVVGAIALVIYAVKRFGPAVKDGIVKAVNWIRDKIGAAVDFIGALPGKLLALGKEMMEKLAEGIKAAAGAVSDAVSGVADDISGALGAPGVPQGAIDQAKRKGVPLSPLMRPGAGPTQGASFTPAAPIFQPSQPRDVVATNTTNTSTTGHTFNFTGMGEPDRAWFRRELTEVLKGSASGAGLNPTFA